MSPARSAASGRPGERPGRRPPLPPIRDFGLRDEILAEFTADPSFDATLIDVEVRDGAVTLTGAADSCTETSAAEQAAERVPGVVRITNAIAPRLPSGLARTDAALAGAAKRALQWHVSEPRDRIDLDVTNGWVTLRGHVQWPFQAGAAEDAVRRLWGVQGVVNEIHLSPEPLASPGEPVEAPPETYPHPH